MRNDNPAGGKPVNGDQALDIAARLIAMAVSLAGSVQEVQACMRSTEADFLDYCAGAKEPTLDELERLISLIIREQGKIIAQNRELLQRVREKQ